MMALLEIIWSLTYETSWPDFLYWACKYVLFLIVVGLSLTFGTIFKKDLSIKWLASIPIIILSKGWLYKSYYKV